MCSITIGELAENNIIKYDDEIAKQVYSPVDNKTSMNNIIISFIYNLDTKSVSLIPATKDGELSSSTTTSKRNIINTTTNQTTKISEPITTKRFCNAENLEKNYLIAAFANKYQNIGKPLTIPGKEVSKENESLMASTEDDYGMSYYFRGNVIDNYVEFANKCWRIVRITGNCGIKLVLSNDNINKSKNPCSASNNDSEAAFARYDGNEYITSFCSNTELDNANIGFMDGKLKADSYAYAQSNTNKSPILLNLEKWYKSNLLAYEEKLDDTIWCNDKSIVTDENFKPDSVFVLKKK